MNPLQQPIDQDAVNLTKAIALQESHANYNAVGDNGTSHGAYQWQPGNFSAAAKKYNLNPDDMSPENQNKVAYAEVKSYKDKGYKPWQIASLWNSGSPDNWQNHSGTKIINGKAIHYDTPSYVNGVKSYYQQLTQGQQPSASAGADNAATTSLGSDSVTTPGVGKTFAGNLIRGLIRPVVRAVNTPIQGAEKLLGIHANQTDQYLGDVSGYGMKEGQTTGQRLKDIGGGLLETAALAVPFLGEAGAVAEGGEAAAEAAKATSLGSKVAQGAKTGAVVGGLGGAGNELDTNPNAGVVSTLSAGAQGALGGAVVGSAAPLVSEGVSKAGKYVSDLFSSKSADEIAQMARDPNVTAKDVSKLSATEQEQYYREKNNINNESITNRRAAADVQKEEIIKQSKEDVKKFQQEAGTNASAKADSLKQPSQQLFRDQSERFAELSQEALARATPESLENGTSKTNLIDKIDNYDDFKDTADRDNSALRNSIKQDLGLNTPEPKAQIDPETKLPIIPTESTPEETLTNQELLTKARDIMRSVGKASKAGNTVYSPAEYQAMQKYSFIMDVLGENGVDLSEANEFWKEWKPVQTRIMREVKPFDEKGIKGNPFAKTLQRAENINPTGQQMSSKIDAQKFVTELESRFGLEKGSLGKEVRESLQNVESSKLNKQNAEQIYKEVKAQLSKEKTETSISNKRQKFDTLKKAKVRKAIGIAIGTVLGLEAVKKVPVVGPIIKAAI